MKSRCTVANRIVVVVVPALCATLVESQELSAETPIAQLDQGLKATIAAPARELVSKSRGHADKNCPSSQDKLHRGPNADSNYSDLRRARAPLLQSADATCPASMTVTLTIKGRDDAVSASTEAIAADECSKADARVAFAAGRLVVANANSAHLRASRKVGL